MRSTLFLLASIAIGAVNASFNNHHFLRDTQRHRARLAARASLTPGWALQSACLTDAPAPNRLLSSFTTNSSLTPAGCVATCNAQGAQYAAVQFGSECHCGSSLKYSNQAGVSAPTSTCSTKCSGSNDMCGGSWHLTLYSKTKATSSSTATPSSTKAASSTASSSTPTSTGKYKLVDSHAGQTFFDNWYFFTASDPTGGQVSFQSKSDATSKGLAYVQDDGIAVMKVDSTTWLSSGQPRNSVRITSQKAYDQGLFLYDVVAMPFGCSVWPAMWQVGPNWPNSGEIDIIENVNNATQNQMTLHTGPSTSCSTASVSDTLVTTKMMGKTCASSDANNAGCNYQETDPTSYGAGFNQIGGAVYAVLIDSTGTKMWRFPRSSAIPSDIEAGSPNPDSWTKPQAVFPSTDSCKTSDVIKQQQIVFDITLCGGWAGNQYTADGCPGTCSDRIMDPNNFQTASWKVKSVKVYQ